MNYRCIANNVDELERVQKILFSNELVQSSIIRMGNYNNEEEEIIILASDSCVCNVYYRKDSYYDEPLRVFLCSDEYELLVSFDMAGTWAKNFKSSLINDEFIKDIIYSYNRILESKENDSNNDIKTESQKQAAPKKLYVYLMTNTRNGYTKIGVSNNPKHRERTLQSEEPEVELIFKRKVINAYRLEKELHEYYSDKRIRGEWFDLTHEQIEECKKLIDSEMKLLHT